MDIVERKSAELDDYTKNYIHCLVECLRDGIEFYPRKRLNSLIRYEIYSIPRGAICDMNMWFSKLVSPRIDVHFKRNLDIYTKELAV